MSSIFIEIFDFKVLNAIYPWYISRQYGNIIKLFSLPLIQTTLNRIKRQHMESFLLVGGLVAFGTVTVGASAAYALKRYDSTTATKMESMAHSYADISSSDTSLNDANNNKTKHTAKNRDLNDRKDHSNINRSKSDMAFYACVFSLIVFLTTYSYKRIVLDNFYTGENLSFAYIYTGFLICMLGNLVYLLRLSGDHVQILKDNRPWCLSVGLMLLLIASLKVLFHYLLENYFADTVPRSLHPVFTCYYDILSINIFLDRFWPKSLKCKELLNQYLGLNYMVWIFFTVFLCVWAQNMRFLTFSQLYWHGLTIAFVLLKSAVSNKRLPCGLDLLLVFDLVRSNEYYFVLIPLRLYGVFKIAGWLV